MSNNNNEEEDHRTVSDSHHLERHEMEVRLSDANVKIEEQRTTINDFQETQSKYKQEIKELRAENAELKHKLNETLWETLPTAREGNVDYSVIPPISTDIVEDNDHVGPYTLIEDLGEGMTATVYSCVNKKNEEFAIKIFKKSDLQSSFRVGRICEEIQVLTKPGLQSTRGILHATDIIHTEQFLYVVTPQAGREMFTHFDSAINTAVVPEAEVQKFLRGIAPAVNALHQHNLAHRDIKPENICISETSGVVTLVDYGMATAVEDEDDHTVYSTVGSPGFFAPEVVTAANDGYDGFKADVWSLGCVLLEMMLSKEQFQEIWLSNFIDESDNLKTFEEESVVDSLDHITTLFNVDRKYASGLKVLVLSMLRIDPEERVGMDAVMRNTWLGLPSPKKSRTVNRRKSERNVPTKLPSAITTTTTTTTAGGPSKVLLRRASAGAVLPKL